MDDRREARNSTMLRSPGSFMNKETRPSISSGTSGHNWTFILDELFLYYDYSVAGGFSGFASLCRNTPAPYYLQHKLTVFSTNNPFKNITVSAAIHLAQSLITAYLTDCGGQWAFWPYPGDTLGPSSKKRPLMEAEASVSTLHFYVGNLGVYGNHKVGPNGSLGQLWALKNTERHSLVNSCYGASAGTSLYLSSAAGVPACTKQERFFRTPPPHCSGSRSLVLVLSPPPLSLNAHKPLGTVYKKFIGS